MTTAVPTTKRSESAVCVTRRCRRVIGRRRTDCRHPRGVRAPGDLPRVMVSSIWGPVASSPESHRLGRYSHDHQPIDSCRRL